MYTVLRSGITLHIRSHLPGMYNKVHHYENKNQNDSHVNDINVYTILLYGAYSLF
jgi:hypothetical protein